MIIAKLMGGLGNQMFQYALARKLALKHGVELKLDISQLNSKTINGKHAHAVRDLGLDNFNIKPAIASQNEIKEYQKNRLSKIIDLFFLYLPVKKNRLYIKEPFFHFFKKAIDAPKDSYLDGYWQSEKYFMDIREQLIKDFKPVNPLSADSIRLAEEILNNQSVSIHVRRTDYVADSNNKEFHGTCSEDYYYEAIKIIANKFPNPKFYIFSDEPAWFKENIKIDFPFECVDFNTGASSYQDICLMSLCKQNIIANSSFSWWGAWLNENENKLVIAPENWFKDQSKNTKDLLPENWIKI